MVYDFLKSCVLSTGRNVMALTRKNLMVDAEQLASLAARRGLSESATVREAITDALFADEFVVAMTVLHETGYGQDNQVTRTPTDDEDEQAAHTS